MIEICKRMEVWSDPVIVVMDYEEHDGGQKQPNGCVGIFFDYDPKPGKVYSIEKVDPKMATVFLDQDGIKGLMEVLKEFVSDG